MYVLEIELVIGQKFLITLYLLLTCDQKHVINIINNEYYPLH